MRKGITKIICDKIFTSKYIIRLDDSCETQNQKNWDQIESILNKHKIVPIVGVIPLNKDKKLIKDPLNQSFWEKINLWQKKGWLIALHGCHHVYHKINQNKSIFPFYGRSEFSGLSLKSQNSLINKAIHKMRSKGINPKIWIAPSHTFDLNTLRALKENSDIEIISDGISLKPYFYKNLLFIPQQLWYPKRLPFGFWTICIHPNDMEEEQINELDKKLSNRFFSGRFINPLNAYKYIEKNHFFSTIFRYLFWFKWNFKKHNL